MVYLFLFFFSLFFFVFMFFFDLSHAPSLSCTEIKIETSASPFVAGFFFQICFVSVSMVVFVFVIVFVFVSYEQFCLLHLYLPICGWCPSSTWRAKAARSCSSVFPLLPDTSVAHMYSQMKKRRVVKFLTNQFGSKIHIYHALRVYLVKSCLD